MQMMCSMPGVPRCRPCIRKIVVAAHADDTSRSQPQEQVTNQRGFLSGMRPYCLQLQSRRHARLGPGVGASLALGGASAEPLVDHHSILADRPARVDQLSLAIRNPIAHPVLDERAGVARLQDDKVRSFALDIP